MRLTYRIFYPIWLFKFVNRSINKVLNHGPRGIDNGGLLAILG
jgi:hypothetical protein